MLRPQPFQQHLCSDDVAIASDEHAASALQQGCAQLGDLAPALRKQRCLIRDFVHSGFVDDLQRGKKSR